MASLSTDKTGLKKIQFTDRNRERPTIYLGRIHRRMLTVKGRIETINSSIIAGHAAVIATRPPG